MNVEIQKRLKKKATIDKEKDSVKPAVINDDLIKEYFFQYKPNKQNAYGSTYDLHGNNEFMFL